MSDESSKILWNQFSSVWRQSGRLETWLLISVSEGSRSFHVNRVKNISVCSVVSDVQLFCEGDWLACHAVFVNHLLMSNTRSNLITLWNCSVTFPRTQLCFWTFSSVSVILAWNQIIHTLLMFDKQQCFYIKSHTALVLTNRTFRNQKPFITV